MPTLDARAVYLSAMAVCFDIDPEVLRRDVFWGAFCIVLLSLTFYLKYSDIEQVKLLLEASERSRETLNRIVLVDMDRVFGELKRYINDDPIPSLDKATPLE